MSLETEFKFELEESSTMTAMGVSGCLFGVLTTTLLIHEVGRNLGDTKKILTIFAIIGIVCIALRLIIPVIARKSHRKKEVVFAKVANIIRESTEIIAKESMKQPIVKYSRDKYNNICSTALWIESFIDGHIKPQLNQQETKVFISIKAYVYECIKKYSISAKDFYLDTIGYYQEMSGVSFEHFCKKLLIKGGWDIQTTATSGDQGVDLIASKLGLTLAIQCKRYQKSVGNKAVQEVLAGAKHYGIRYPIVVTNSTYTKQAYELANSTGVMLLHFSELENLYHRLTSR